VPKAAINGLIVPKAAINGLIDFTLQCRYTLSMSEETQRKLAAIVSADVVGYSRLMGVDEVGTHARLKSLFSELVQPKILEHGGRVVKLMGDGLFDRLNTELASISVISSLTAMISSVMA
jgi:adenylate cyclase